MVQEFHEKSAEPPGDLANAAVYIIEPEVVDFLTKLNKSQIDFSTEVIPNFIGRIFTWHNHEYLRDIGSISDYLAAQLDYPDKAPLPDPKHDSWRQLYLDGELDLNGFIKALNRALDIGPGTDNATDKVIVAREDQLEDLPFTTPARAGHKKISDCPLLLFPETGTDFSAKEIYSRYKINNLAFCAHR